MTPKQARFIAEYLIDLNATQAAIRAGYSAKTANQQGPRLLVNVGIAAALSARQAKQLAAADLSATRVLEELRRLAFVDVSGVFDDDGNLKPIKAWTIEQRAALAAFEVVKRNLTAGDRFVDSLVKVKFADKTKNLDLLAQHFALLTTRVEVSGDEAMFALLNQGRQRNAERA